MVYVFLADGFETVEALAAVDCLRRANIETVTVGVTGKTVVSSHKIPVVADTTEFAFSDDLEMIVLPGGGRGYDHLRESAEVGEIIDRCVSAGVPVAAICAAPAILGERGLLDGLHATCFPDMQEQLTGAIYEHRAVCVDGQFITGHSAGHSFAFGIKLVEKLRGSEAAKKLKQSLYQDV